MRRLRLSPAVALFVLAPAIGELLSSSMPPSEFFNPVSFTLAALLYGSGAILVRELALRWGKGWPSILVLGAAYGIVEEGLACKSFFDPNWADVGILGSYGRWAGVNWVWSVELTVYHAVFSIAIPILLASLAFPERRAEPWVGPRALKILAGLMAADVVLMHFAITPYRPPWPLIVLAVLAVLGLAQLARRLPAPAAGPSDVAAPRARRFWLAGFLATVAFFLASWALPNLIPAPATLLLLLGLPWVVWRGLRALTRGWHAWSAPHQLALAAGALSFFIALAPLIEMDRTRTDNPAGQTLVGVAAALALVWLARRVGRPAACRP